MRVTLRVIRGGASKPEVVLDLPAIIGRSRGCQLTIAHPMVSRQHCRLFESDGALVLADLGSLNGTTVGGEPVQQATIRPGDEFTVGPLTFRAEYESPARPSAFDGADPSAEETPADVAGKADVAFPPDAAPVGGDIPMTLGIDAESVGPPPADFLGTAIDGFAGNPDVEGEPSLPPPSRPSRPSAWTDAPLADSRWHFPIEAPFSPEDPGLRGDREPIAEPAAPEPSSSAEDRTLADLETPPADMDSPQEPARLFHAIEPTFRQPASPSVEEVWSLGDERLDEADESAPFDELPSDEPASDEPAAAGPGDDSGRAASPSSLPAPPRRPPKPGTPPPRTSKPHPPVAASSSSPSPTEPPPRVETGEGRAPAVSDDDLSLREFFKRLP